MSEERKNSTSSRKIKSEITCYITDGLCPDGNSWCSVKGQVCKQQRCKLWKWIFCRSENWFEVSCSLRTPSSEELRTNRGQLWSARFLFLFLRWTKYCACFRKPSLHSRIEKFFLRCLHSSQIAGGDNWAELHRNRHRAILFFANTAPNWSLIRQPPNH